MARHGSSRMSRHRPAITDWSLYDISSVVGLFHWGTRAVFTRLQRRVMFLGCMFVCMYLSSFGITAGSTTPYLMLTNKVLLIFLDREIKTILCVTKMAAI